MFLQILVARKRPRLVLHEVQRRVAAGTTDAGVDSRFQAAENNQWLRRCNHVLVFERTKGTTAWWTGGADSEDFRAHDSFPSAVDSRNGVQKNHVFGNFACGGVVHGAFRLINDAEMATGQEYQASEPAAPSAMLNLQDVSKVGYGEVRSNLRFASASTTFMPYCAIMQYSGSEWAIWRARRLTCLKRRNEPRSRTRKISWSIPRGSR